MQRIRNRLTAAVLVLALAGTAMLAPRALDAGRLLAAADDSEALTEIGLSQRFTPAVATAEIKTALAADDVELAVSMLELADERGMAITQALRAKVEDANGAAATVLRTAGRFVGGVFVGQPNDAASLAGTVAGDLLLIGDLRDAIRETAHLARGEPADELILGLSALGLVVTAGTYATLGAGAPARLGISAVKAASKTGRLTARMAQALVRPLRGVVDTAALRKTLHAGSLLEPAVAVRGIRSAVKLDKAQGVLRTVSDLGRIQGKAGARAALDGLRLAESPKDLARLARVAGAKGSKTRAVFKVLGRAAIVLTVGLFQLTSWIGWTVFMLLGACLALKRLTETNALRFFRWQRARKARPAVEAATAASLAAKPNPAHARLPVAPALVPTPLAYAAAPG